MKASYGNRFRHVPNSLHQRELAEEISKCRIVVAPDSPVTDRYWSNRVYLMLGFGAFLLHPYCTDLAKEYVEGKELVFYRDRSDLHDKVAYFLAHPEERLAIAQAGYERTLRDHTYTKRCERLIELVQAGIKAKAGVS
jgi:spore maturation protein CgeB